MYTYSQLISKNIVSATIFSVIFTVVVVMLTSMQLSNQQHDQIKLVQSYFDQELALSDEKIVEKATSLFASKLFSKLHIDNADNKNIFSKSTTDNWLSRLLLPDDSSVRLIKHKFNIKFRSNIDSQATTLGYTCIAMAICLLLMVFISGKQSISRYKNIIRSINQQIKTEITHVLSNNDDNKEQEALFDLPELNSGIAEIKAQINSHIKDTGNLKQEAYIEPLTQLENRTRFVQFFDKKNESIDFGVLTITRCSELQTINQIHGYTEGDNYICKVAEILKNASTKFQSSKIFRLNSSDFATILPNTTLKAAESYADDVMGHFNEYQQSSDLDSVGYTGLVAFDKTNPLGELLALADTGISVAQTKQQNAWYAQTDTNILESSSASYGNQNWRQEIDNVLENQRVTLLIQHIKPTSRNAKVYSEVLARFLNSNNEMLPTASFIAMAEKLDKIVDVDRMIIEQAITEISDKNLTEQHFGINISARTIHDEHFLIWLERRLLKVPAIASNLIFEITEYGLQQNLKTSKRFIDMVHRAGSRVTVERFGVGLTSFKFFRDLKPDFIKMDSTYTHDIDEDKNNQYFLRLMVDLAHRLSITVLAESVESQEEKYTLEKLFIDGCQGFYIGRPEPI